MIIYMTTDLRIDPSRVQETLDTQKSIQWRHVNRLINLIVDERSVSRNSRSRITH